MSGRDEFARRLASDNNDNFVKSTDPKENFARRLAEKSKDEFIPGITRLKSSNYIVAYLDVLGATKYMEDDSEKFLNNLNAIYEKALDDVTFTNVVTKKNITIKIFSDNILIAVKTNPNDINRAEKIQKIVNLAGNIYCNALANGYLIRGGVTEGKFFSNSTFVFGKALVEAVKLEEKIAIYPRVIVQDELIHSIPQYVWLDNDGKYYLNSFIFTGLRAPIAFKVSIIKQLQEFHAKAEVKQKLMWLVNYFNQFYGSEFGDRIDKLQISLQDISEVINGVSNEVVNEQA